MAQQILVPLKRYDRIGEVIPSISEVARPGTKVVFLVPYVTDDVTAFTAHGSTMETGMYSAIRLAKAMEK